MSAEFETGDPGWVARADDVRSSRVEPLAGSGPDPGSPWLRLLAHRARLREAHRWKRAKGAEMPGSNWGSEWGAT